MALGKMIWSGATGWTDTETFERGLWLDGPKSVGGYMKKYKNLNLLSVYNSGHMVPYNRPQLALDLITRYLGNRTYMDVPLPKFKARRYERAELVPVQSEDIDSFSDSTNSSTTLSLSTILIPLIFLFLGICIGILATGLRHRKQGYEPL
jgi:Serine carboxypeptidase